MWPEVNCRFHGTSSCGLVAALFGWAWVATGVAAQDPRGVEFFENRVRPVLVARCHECHGAKKQESGLRLDSREAILRGGDSGPVVVPREAAASRLVEAIRYDGDLKMPPDEPLSPAEIEALTAWVQAGVEWPADGSPETSPAAAPDPQSHWAFQAIQVGRWPATLDQVWAREPVDVFVRAGMESAALDPAAPADRRTLLRRASFDLTGLPPAWEDVQAFSADESPDAWERAVDRLLASPRYGERWGRHWLDVARYADNKGYVFFEDKNFPWAYTYRDYVIQALNEDRPFDRLVMEQLAADQLDLAGDSRRLAALGYLTLGGHFMNNSHDVIDDRIDVVARGLLGLTVTCARCHDHKYDPVTQVDYYTLYGVFRNSHEPIVPPLYGAPPKTEEYEKFAAELARREKQLTDFIDASFKDLVQGARTRVGEYLWTVYERKGHPPADDFMLLTDKGAINPTMVVRWEVYLKETAREHHRVWAPWHELSELPPEDFASQAAARVRQWTSRTDGLRVNALVLEALADPPQSIHDVAERYGRLFQKIDAAWQQKLSECGPAQQPEPLADAEAEELRQVLYGADTPPMLSVVLGWGFLSLFPDRPTQAEYQKLLKAVEEWSTQGTGAPPRAMVLVDDTNVTRARVFLRGNPNRLGPHAARELPAILGGPSKPITRGSGRLQLAQLIVDPANPLTSRVIANRIWLHHFGEGLVRTPSDFGLRGEPPTHPELLDYLARDLIENGWSIKQLHRRLLASATYRQASQADAGSPNKDPENRLLARMNRRRLEFEATRDSLLAVADQLDSRMEGPPVDLLRAGFQGRRSVYGFIDRMDVDPLLTTFDFPNPAATSGKRETTTVAPQALYLMNHEFPAAAAARLVERPEIQFAGSTCDKISRLYERVLARQPDPLELELGTQYLGVDATPERLLNFAQALLMTNEFLFVD